MSGDWIHAKFTSAATQIGKCKLILFADKFWFRDGPPTSLNGCTELGFVLRRLFRISKTGVIAFAFMASAVGAQVAIGFGDTPHDSDAPVEVVSDDLTIDQEIGLAVFTGNVVVVQGDLTMAAAEVRVSYVEDDDGTEVNEVLASGGVVMTRGEDAAAEGQNAVYSIESGEVVMTGSVLVTQGDDTIAGERLTIDLNTGDAVVTGRVRTVLSRD